MIVIGLTGAAGSGKDTAASEIQSRYGFAVVHFSDALKRGLATMFSWSTHDLDGATPRSRAFRESPVRVSPTVTLPPPRYMMQTLGTEWGRETIHPDVWVLATEAYIESSGHERVVISDVRFNNEAQWIHSKGGIVVEVVRDGAGIAGGHSSERGLDSTLIDDEITNNGTIEGLKHKAADLALWKINQSLL